KLGAAQVEVVFTEYIARRYANLPTVAHHREADLEGNPRPPKRTLELGEVQAEHPADRVDDDALPAPVLPGDDRHGHPRPVLAHRQQLDLRAVERPDVLQREREQA